MKNAKRNAFSPDQSLHQISVYNFGLLQLQEKKQVNKGILVVPKMQPRSEINSLEAAAEKREWRGKKFMNKQE